MNTAPATAKNNAPGCGGGTFGVTNAAEGALWEALQRWQASLGGWYQPHGRQLAFHAAGAGAHERLFLAGNRVGKTLAGAAEVAFHLSGAYPPWWQGVRFAQPVQAWAASVTREATRDILQATYLGNGSQRGVIEPLRVVAQRLKGGGAVDTVSLRHASGGLSVLGFKSFDQGRASFQGTARHVVHLDEEPPLEVYQEALLRTLTVHGHVLLTMTPLLGLTPLLRHFLGQEHTVPQAGKAVVRAGWADALHLDAAAQARLRASLPPHELAAREHGDVRVGKGLVYPVDEREVAVPRFAIPPHWRRIVGVDFGFVAPTAAVWLAHDAATDTVYVTDTYAVSERTPAAHAAAILARGACPAVCDPAGQAASQRDGVSLMELYAQAGLHFTRADNTVEHGLMVVLERLRMGRLKVFADLPAWWAEYRTYMRDAKGRVVKQDDHLLDATRYAVVSLGLARATGEVSGLRRPRGRDSDWRTV
jgi:phage terminase large subunit-like protein